MGCWGLLGLLLIVSQWKGSKMGSVRRFFFGRASRNDVWRPLFGMEDGGEDGGHTKICERACFSWAISGVKSLSLKLQFLAITK